MTTGGNTPTATMKHHATRDLEEEDDVDSFASSLISSSCEEPIPADNMDEDNLQDAQDGAPISNNPPDQGATVTDFNSTVLEVSQTKLITEAAKDLDMDSVKTTTQLQQEKTMKQSDKMNLVQKMRSMKSNKLMI